MNSYLSIITGAAFFKSDSFDKILDIPKKTLVKWSIYYLVGLIFPAAVMTWITKMGEEAITIKSLTYGIASYIFIILLINISYLLLVDVIFDIRFKKKQTKKTILAFCSVMNFFNFINGTLKALVFYLIIHHTYDLFFTKIKYIVYTAFLFLFWWQWMVETRLFSQIYSKKLIFTPILIVFFRLLSFTIMIIIGSRLWVGIFTNLGLSI